MNILMASYYNTCNNNLGAWETMAAPFYLSKNSSTWRWANNTDPAVCVQAWCQALHDRETSHTTLLVQTNRWTSWWTVHLCFPRMLGFAKMCTKMGAAWQLVTHPSPQGAELTRSCCLETLRAGLCGTSSGSSTSTYHTQVRSEACFKCSLDPLV